MMQDGNRGWRNWSDHPIVVLILVAAAIVSIFIFVTGFENIGSMFSAAGNHATNTPATPNPSQAEPPIVYGNLLYEENFEGKPKWDLIDDKVIDGNLIIGARHDAVPYDSGSYTDFILESKFYYPEGSSGMAYYVRQQQPPCPGWNCSIQISLDFTYDTIVARRFHGNDPVQDISLPTSLPQLSPDRWNKIVIVGNGDQYSVYINDSLVSNFADSSYTSGTFMLDNNGPTEIKVDYVRIFSLPQ